MLLGASHFFWSVHWRVSQDTDVLQTEHHPLNTYVKYESSCIFWNSLTEVKSLINTFIHNNNPNFTASTICFNIFPNFFVNVYICSFLSCRQSVMLFGRIWQIIWILLIHISSSRSVFFLSIFSIFFFSTDLQSDSWQTVSCPIILFDARSRGQGRVMVAARAHMHANTCTRNFILGWLPLITADFPNSAVFRSLALSLGNICVWSESCINYSPAAAPCLRLSLLVCFLWLFQITNSTGFLLDCDV